MQDLREAICQIAFALPEEWSQVCARPRCLDEPEVNVAIYLRAPGELAIDFFCARHTIPLELELSELGTFLGFVGLPPRSGYCTMRTGLRPELRDATVPTATLDKLAPQCGQPTNTVVLYVAPDFVSSRFGDVCLHCGGSEMRMAIDKREPYVSSVRRHPLTAWAGLSPG